MGPNGQLCGNIVLDAESSSVSYKNPSGQLWTLSESGADTKVLCPDGSEVIVTSTQKEAVKSCTTDESTSGACVSGDDIGGGQCTSTSECQSGQTCCELGEIKVCLLEAACPN